MSNDLKYVLLPTVEDRTRPPKFQPWYRERIRMKYPCNVNTKNWKFVKDGLDDFRDGLPPSHDDIILESEKGPGPVILSEKRRIKATASNAQTRLKEHQIYYSRQIPAVEKRRRMVDNYISVLLDHPMAFFEHFNQTLPSEMYERLTKLLEAELLISNNQEQSTVSDEHRGSRSFSSSDQVTQVDTSAGEKNLPELNSQEMEKNFESRIVNKSPDDSSVDQVQSDDQPSEDTDSKDNSIRIGHIRIVYDESGSPWDAEELKKKQKNPYRWFIDKEYEKQKVKGPTQAEKAAAAMEARLINASEQFCNWLYELGGKKNEDFDSNAVRNLFSTAYDTKPSLNVPIKIVDMENIPVELREATQDETFPIAEPTRRISSGVRMASSSTKSKRTTSAHTELGPRTQKYRYGAWYLPKHLWQRALTTDQLRDPKIVKAERDDLTRQREEEINARLAPLKCVNAFKEYLQGENYSRLPKLIADVDKYRRHQTRKTTPATTELQAKRTVQTAP